MAGLFSHGFALAELLPPSLLSHAPLLADALDFFFAALPAERQQELTCAQAALPPGAPAAIRALTLLQACPTLHKLGQMLARHRPLPLELRRRLQQLESMPGGPLVPAQREWLEQDWAGALESGEIAVGAQALAEGSVAAVFPVRLRIGSETQGAVVKILKPRAAARLTQELDIWPRLGAYLDQRCAAYRLPPLDYQELFETLRALLLSEIDVAQEQENLLAAANAYRETRGFRVPRLLPQSTPRLTLMERLDGVKLTQIDAWPEAVMMSAGRDDGLGASADSSAASGTASPGSDRAVASESRAARRRAALLTARALVAEALWRSDEHSLFHADPHAGNLLWLAHEQAVGALDWSLSARLGKRQRVVLTHVLLAAVRCDPEEIARELSALAMAPPASPAALLDAVRGALRTLVGDALAGTDASAAAPPARLPGLHWLMLILDRAVQEAGLKLPRELLLFRKSLLTLEGVIADLSPDVTLDGALTGELAALLLREWPQRALRPAEDTQLASHIPTAQMLRLLLEAPFATMRWWQLRASR